VRSTDGRGPHARLLSANGCKPHMPQRNVGEDGIQFGLLARNTGTGTRGALRHGIRGTPKGEECMAGRAMGAAWAVAPSSAPWVGALCVIRRAAADVENGSRRRKRERDGVGGALGSRRRRREREPWLQHRAEGGTQKRAGGDVASTCPSGVTSADHTSCGTWRGGGAGGRGGRLSGKQSNPEIRVGSALPPLDAGSRPWMLEAALGCWKPPVPPVPVGAGSGSRYVVPSVSCRQADRPCCTAAHQFSSQHA
jgi:hypothetical protein